MSEFTIITDSCCDLPDKIAKELDIIALPLTVMIDETEYTNYLDERDITFKDFYALIANKNCSTSALNVDAFTTTFEKELIVGNDILCLSFSSALSNTYNASTIAATELAVKYPDRKIYTLDTLCASLGQGLLVYLTAQEKMKGKTIEEVRYFAENIKINICHWFTVDDLHFLKRGGRISKTSAMLGTMLNIKPVLHVDNEGRLINMFKARGRNTAINMIIDKISQTAINPREQTVFISHGDCIEDAEKAAALIRQRIGVKDIVINYIGPVVGAHSGPGTLAIFFIGTER